MELVEGFAREKESAVNSRLKSRLFGLKAVVERRTGCQHRSCAQGPDYTNDIANSDVTIIEHNCLVINWIGGRIFPRHPPATNLHSE